MKHRRDTAVRGAAFALGLMCALGTVVAWRMPPGTGRLGADVVFTSEQIGELEVAPAGAFLSGTAIFPGPRSDAQTGRLEMRNITNSTLAVRLHALPSGTDLDPLLWVQITVGDTQLFEGTLGALRSWTRPLTLQSDQTRHLELATWLPQDTGEGFSGRIEQVPLELDATAEGSA